MHFTYISIIPVGRVAQSVRRQTTCWTVRDRIPVGTRFSASSDRPWVPPSLLYNGYQVFPGGRGGRVVGLTPTPIHCRGPRKSRAIPLLTLRAFVAYKKGEKLPTVYQKMLHILDNHFFLKTLCIYWLCAVNVCRMHGGLVSRMRMLGTQESSTTVKNFDVLLTVHLSIFILVINQLNAQNFCFAISLFQASTCFEHMCSKHVDLL